MNYRDIRDAQSALRNFAGIQETLARIERDRLEAMQPIASRVVELRRNRLDPNGPRREVRLAAV